MSNKSNWIKVFESNNLITTELLKTLLAEEHNIDAVVMNKQISGYNFGKCELHVLENNKTEAEAVIEQFLNH